VRLVAGEQGELIVDPAQRRPGRGVYACDRYCARLAARRGAFARSMRRPVTIGEHVVESVAVH
jgi:predicted RNA-binding protein YlxR (DUF448 family)